MKLRELAEPPALLKFKGADYKLPRDLKINSSFFMPALKPKETYEVVVEYYKPFHYKLTWSERIEGGVLGIRVWRVL